MKTRNLKVWTIAAGLGLVSAVAFGQGPRTAAIGPWVFSDGNETSRTMVVDIVRHVAEHHGLSLLPQDAVGRAADSVGENFGLKRGSPSMDQLSRFAATVHADFVICGKASWHTRSIWVGTGPKTISTATIDLYIFNANRGTITYSKRGIEGRSDEKESALKDVGDIILTPFITVVSGGPATPREQRAAQIAIGRAFRPWAKRRDVNQSRQ